MNKDVIYIDVDDDVTAIIGKIKNTKEKIVALVPPKRAGVLQSAVNLRLLDRMARTEKKKLVLISSNQALVALAASAKIPVAKNLQSKPEIAQIEALKVDDGDDIIDGSELPVGDLAKTAGASATASAVRQKPVRVDDTLDVSGIDIDGEDVAAKSATAKPRQPKTGSGRKSPKIPNFDTFRKKLIWIMGGGAALVALLVWMFVFAPAATIVITASTSPLPVTTTARLAGTELTDGTKGVISSTVQEEVAEESIEFEATGDKDVGEKATGTVTIRNCENNAFTLGAGTPFTATNGKVYYSTTSANVSAGSVSGLTQALACQANGSNGGTGSVTVQAAESGTAYNIGSSNYSVGGTSGGVSARGGTMTGGTTRVVKVVTEADIEKAKEQLSEKSADEYKKMLEEKFGKDQVVIAESFTTNKGEVTSTPAVGKEAPDGEAKLTVKTTFSMSGVSKTDLDDFLKEFLDANVDDKQTQKVYGTGVDKATFANFQKTDDGASVTISSDGRIGPKIDEDEVKENARGKRYGDIQQSLQQIDGVRDVDVKFSFFWVNKVPNNTDKIKIEFKVNENDD